MKHSRIARTIFAAIFLICFGIYTYLTYPLRVTSDDIADWGPAGGLHNEGYGLAENAIDMNAAALEMQQAKEAEEAAAQEAEAEEPEQAEEEAPVSPAAAAAAQLGLPTPPDIDIDDWMYQLVNGDNPLEPKDYAPAELAYLNQTASDTNTPTSYDGNRLPVDSRIAQPLLEMALGCKDAGLPIFLSSGYRSYNDQAANFTRVCNNNGVTDGKDANGYYITMPAGCSEHQLALCCDITDVYREIKNSEIENTDTYKWLKANCTDYGFILRFPEDKKDFTGVMYEPFHFRYVGVEVAKYMEANNLCLEEFVALYK